MDQLTGLALRRAVFAAIGYTIENQREGHGDRWVAVRRPDGEECAIDALMFPPIEKSTDAALDLALQDNLLEYNLFTDLDGHTCEMGYWGKEPGERDIIVSSDWGCKTPAEAVCNALLKWLQRPTENRLNRGEKHGNHL